MLDENVMTLHHSLPTNFVVNGWLINEGFAALIRSATALCVLGAFSHQDTAVIAHEMNRSRWAWRLESIVLDRNWTDEIDLEDRALRCQEFRTNERCNFTPAPA